MPLIGTYPLNSSPVFLAADFTATLGDPESAQTEYAQNLAKISSSHRLHFSQRQLHFLVTQAKNPRVARYSSFSHTLPRVYQ